MPSLSVPLSLVIFILLVAHHYESQKRARKPGMMKLFFFVILFFGAVSILIWIYSGQLPPGYIGLFVPMFTFAILIEEKLSQYDVTLNSPPIWDTGTMVLLAVFLSLVASTLYMWSGNWVQAMVIFAGHFIIMFLHKEHLSWIFKR